MAQKIVGKAPYICGPLTELSLQDVNSVKLFYAKLADLCREVLHVRAFVPHEHCDPTHHAKLTPEHVDKIERIQVCEKTSLLIVVAIAPSWGGGIEVEMARQSCVPVVILHPEAKIVSRLLRGNPAVKKIIPYTTFDNALLQLEAFLFNMNREKAMAS